MSKYDVKCPECDSDMVIRKSTYGSFWGCTNYPNCKGTRDNMGRSKEERDEEREKEDKRFGKSRIYADDRRDRETLDNLMKEVEKHDLKEGQKCSFNKKAK